MTYLEVARKTYLENRTKYLYIELGIHPYENKEELINRQEIIEYYANIDIWKNTDKHIPFKIDQRISNE